MEKYTSEKGFLERVRDSYLTKVLAVSMSVAAGGCAGKITDLFNEYNPMNESGRFQIVNGNRVLTSDLKYDIGRGCFEDKDGRVMTLEDLENGLPKRLDYTCGGPGGENSAGSAEHSSGQTGRGGGPGK